MRAALFSTRTALTGFTLGLSGVTQGFTWLHTTLLCICIVAVIELAIYEAKEG